MPKEGGTWHQFAPTYAKANAPGELTHGSNKKCIPLLMFEPVGTFLDVLTHLSQKIKF